MVALVFVLSACGTTTTPTTTTATPTETATDAEPVTILLAAAASLEASFRDELIPLFEGKNSSIKVEGTYDASGKLQTQIEEGLEAAVFMSAAPKQMNALVEGGLINEADVVKLLENELVLITGVDTDTKVVDFASILDAETIAIGDPASVPVGQYSETVFTNLEMWDDVSAKASLATNVTEVLNQVAEGSAEVGIVYATDAAQMPDKVKVIATAPEGSMDKVIYPVAVLKDAPAEANAFVEFLQSDEAMAIFVKNGFKSNLK